MQILEAQVGKLKGCHTLFVPEHHDKTLPAIAQELKGQPTLILGENPASTKNGVMIAIHRVRGKLRWNTHLGNMKEAGLKPSVQILKLANNIEQ